MNKYEALTEALKRAATAAREAVAINPEDGGTCNFDAPTQARRIDSNGPRGLF